MSNPFNNFNLNEIDLKKIQQQSLEFKDRVMSINRELTNTRRKGQAGGSMIEVEMNGHFTVETVKLDPAILAKNITTIQDLIASAVNDVTRQIANLTQEKMFGMLQGSGIPGTQK
ncbi:MAG: YbaB/EbfC family nucleoid-associated protein [Gammaproteobacteria bacterium]|nr:YbaB/EbfC family nucleoid-associated protein [Gammaproteobacteria bacterium]